MDKDFEYGKSIGYPIGLRIGLALAMLLMSLFRTYCKVKYTLRRPQWHKLS